MKNKAANFNYADFNAVKNIALTFPAQKKVYLTKKHHL